MRYLIFLLLLISSTAFAGPSRVIDADQITSSGKARSFLLPTTSTQLMGIDTSDTVVNKTISGASNTLEQVPVASEVQREVPSGLVNGANTTFTLTLTPVAISSVQVLLNGILQIEGALGDYTISGNTITFNEAPALAQDLIVIYPRY